MVETRLVSELVLRGVNLDSAREIAQTLVNDGESELTIATLDPEFSRVTESMIQTAGIRLHQIMRPIGGMGEESDLFTVAVEFPNGSRMLED